jgi:glutamine synthetase
MAAMDTDENAELMEKYNVLSEREFKSRNEIYLERYVKEVSIESKLVFRIAKTMIFPAAVDYQSKLASTSNSLKTLGKEHCTTVLDELNGLMAKLQTEMTNLEATIHHESKGGLLDHAKHMRDKVLPAMCSVRDISDKLESIVADELWPLPTYQEILFVK